MKQVRAGGIPVLNCVFCGVKGNRTPDPHTAGRLPPDQGVFLGKRHGFDVVSGDVVVKSIVTSRIRLFTHVDISKRITSGAAIQDPRHGTWQAPIRHFPDRRGVTWRSRLPSPRLGRAR